MHVLVHTPIGSTGGYARDGMGLVKGLLNRGHSVALAPTGVLPPVSREVAALLQHPIRGPFDLEIHHVPPSGASSFGLANKDARKPLRVLWTMWEWDEYGEDTPGFEKASTYFPTFDHLVFYTEQSKSAFENAGIVPDDKPVSVLQGGIDSSLWKERPRKPSPDDAYVFAMVGIMSARKHPYAVLQAFNDLKSEMGDDFNARLIIKTSFPMLPKDYQADSVAVVDMELTDPELQEFYWNIDCLVNCAWGEGKDLPAMEALLSGCSVILNDNPGHRGWVHPGIMELVKTTHMNMIPELTGYFTSVDDIKEAMLNSYKKRAAARVSAGSLAARVRKTYDWERRVELLGKKINLPL